VTKGDLALRYAYTFCFNRYSTLIGAESRHFLLRDFVVIHYENGNSKRKAELLTEGNVTCVAVTHRENWMCVEVCGLCDRQQVRESSSVQGDRQLQRSTPVRRYDYFRCQHAVGLGGVVGGPTNFLFNGYWVPTSE
jgi:hypothetical protein